MRILNALSSNWSRGLLSVTLSIFLLTGCQTGTGEPPSEPPTSPPQTRQISEVALTPGRILPGVGLAELSLGSGRDEALEALGSPSETDHNEFVPGQSFQLYHDQGIELTFQDDRLEAITVHAGYEPWTAYRGATEAAVGVGSTAASVLEVYGEPSERSPEALRYSEQGLWFRLDGSYLDSPENVRVESVSVLAPN